jgi:hypothetical protein
MTHEFFQALYEHDFTGSEQLLLYALESSAWARQASPAELARRLGVKGDTVRTSLERLERSACLAWENQERIVRPVSCWRRTQVRSLEFLRAAVALPLPQEPTLESALKEVAREGATVQTAEAQRRREDGEKGDLPHSEFSAALNSSSASLRLGGEQQKEPDYAARWFAAYRQDPTGTLQRSSEVRGLRGEGRSGDTAPRSGDTALRSTKLESRIPNPESPPRSGKHPPPGGGHCNSVQTVTVLDQKTVTVHSVRRRLEALDGPGVRYRAAEINLLLGRDLEAVNELVDFLEARMREAAEGRAPKVHGPISFLLGMARKKGLLR